MGVSAIARAWLKGFEPIMSGTLVEVAERTLRVLSE